MLYEESRWIKKTLAKIELPAGSQAIDLGSASKKFRTEIQPYITKNVISPLVKRKILVTHADRSHYPGIDLIVDIEKPKLTKRYDLVLCANMLEHVTSVTKVAKNIIRLVKPGGYLLVSVPNLYHYHPFPIDNGFRPTARELAALFPGQKIIKAETIKDRKRQSHVFKYKVSLVLLQKKKKTRT